MATISISVVLSIYTFLKVVDIITYVPLTIQNLLNTNEDILDGISGIGDVAVDVRGDIIDSTISIEISATKTKDRRDYDTYYHATSKANAVIILATGILKGGRWEGGIVFAWECPPTKKALKLSGAILAEVLIKFETIAAFEPDGGISNKYVQKFKPVKSVFSMPVRIKNAYISRKY